MTYTNLSMKAGFLTPSLDLKRELLLKIITRFLRVNIDLVKDKLIKIDLSLIFLTAIFHLMDMRTRT